MRLPRASFLRSWRGAAFLVSLLLILFLFRPGLYQLRNRIANSIGSALGRRVTLDNVHLHFLPRPGFDLEGLVIYDDPSFSPEPMIRAQEVSAAIRVRSLFRGRLEIATLSANEPSINLVRNSQGAWNLARLLERNAQIPVAPTGKPASERRPAFPYLEAGNARINFKIGQVKKSYAFINADVALWQDSENSWGARIRAEPVRTDFNLTDTGLILINATWQRSANLRLTPLQIALQWQKGQLGQITKLLSGKDRGWRGGVDLNAKISGSPELLRVESQTAIDDFHRYDIVESTTLRLAASCTGQYNAITAKFSDLLCQSPVGQGSVRLRGDASVLSPTPVYDLALEAEQVPLSSIVQVLRQAKKQVPSDLTATGFLNAEFHATRAPDTLQPNRHSNPVAKWTGSGAATGIRMISNGDGPTSRKNEIAFKTIPLLLVSALKPSPIEAANLRRSPALPARDFETIDTHLRIGPVAFTMNGSAPVDTGGWISRTGYRFSLRGDVELENLFRLIHLLGLPETHPAVQGAAKLDLNLAGPWQGFAVASTSGTAQLRNLRAEMLGFNTPIEIISANVVLDPDALLFQKVAARTADTHWTGNVTSPRHCAPLKCTLQFDLTADQLTTQDLAEWFTPRPAKRAWYRILSPTDAQATSPVLAIRAQGNLRVGRLTLNKALVTQLSSQVMVDEGKLTLTALRAQLLQGSHQGNWMIDFSGNNAPAASSSLEPTPVVHLHGNGSLGNVSLDQVSSLMDDRWISGTADGKFDLQSSGDNLRELIARSDGTIQFVMRNGVFTHLELPGSAAPLPVHHFVGMFQLKQGTWRLLNGKLESRDGFYSVTGNASPVGNINFVLTRGGDQPWNFTGTLAKPKLSAPGPVDRTRAQANPTITP